MKKITFFLLTFFLLITAFAGNQSKTGDLQFIHNAGQWNPAVLFASDIQNGKIFLEQNGFTWNFSNISELGQLKHAGDQQTIDHFILKGHAFKTNFLNSNPLVQVAGNQMLSNYYNYYAGNNPAQLQTQVSAYRSVVYDNLYEGIDLVMYSENNSLKYDLIISPDVSPNKIRLNYEGVSDVRLIDNNLEITTSVNTITEIKPVAYQIINGKKVDIPCQFQLINGEVSFIFPQGYFTDYELVIDPAVLIFCTYSGSTTDNWGYAATYDSEGNVYGAGIGFANGYPVTPGAYQMEWADGGTPYICDITISKFSSDGTSLIYSTYLGGSKPDIAYSMATDNDDNLIVFGVTGSDDFPVTVDAADISFNGGDTIVIDYVINFENGTDAFVAKFNAEGSNLIASTYIGGSDNDAVNLDSTNYNYADYSRSDVSIDDEGAIYIASSTRSSDLPVSGSFQTVLGGGQDAFLAKFNFNLSSLLWCSYLGGSGADAAFSLKKISSSSFAVCGGTASPDFPVTAGVYHTSFAGGRTDGYVTIFSSDGDEIISSTYLGTDKYDQNYLIDADDFSSIYVTGQTRGDFPVTDDVYSNENAAQFITKLDAGLTTIQYSTVFGSGSHEVNIAPTAFLVDDDQHIYIAGWGGNVNQTYNIETGNVEDMPLTADAFQSTTDGSDFYFIIFDTGAAGLIYATYFGGAQSQEHVDGGTSCFDENGVLYEAVCAGCGGNDDLPVTTGVWSEVNNASNCNLGIVKFDFNAVDTVGEFTDSSPGTSFSIYPNPVAEGLLTLQFFSPENISVNIVITDYQGRKIVELNNTDLHTGKQKIKIQIPELANGMYLLSVYSSLNRVSRPFTILK